MPAALFLCVHIECWALQPSLLPVGEMALPCLVVQNVRALFMLCARSMSDPVMRKATGPDTAVVLLQ